MIERYEEVDYLVAEMYCFRNVMRSRTMKKMKVAKFGPTLDLVTSPERPHSGVPRYKIYEMALGVAVGNLSSRCLLNGSTSGSVYIIDTTVQRDPSQASGCSSRRARIVAVSHFRLE